MSTNAAFPPYEMTTDAGDFEGIDIEVAGAIAKKLGLELQVDDMDFDAALLAAQNGKSDMVMAGVTVTDERQKVMDFSDTYAEGIQSIIVPEDSDIASADDLAGKIIGTQRGTTGYIYCTDDFGEDSVVAYDDGLTAEQRPGRRCCYRQRPRQGVRGCQPRPEDPGYRLCPGRLRHRRGQGQHRAAERHQRRTGRAAG